MEGYLYPLVTDRVTWGFGVFELKYNKLNWGGVGLPFEWLKEKRELRLAEMGFKALFGKCGFGVVSDFWLIRVCG